MSCLACRTGVTSFSFDAPTEQTLLSVVGPFATELESGPFSRNSWTGVVRCLACRRCWIVFIEPPKGDPTDYGIIPEGAQTTFGARALDERETRLFTARTAAHLAEAAEGRDLPWELVKPYLAEVAAREPEALRTLQEKRGDTLDLSFLQPHLRDWYNAHKRPPSKKLVFDTQPLPAAHDAFEWLVADDLLLAATPMLEGTKLTAFDLQGGKRWTLEGLPPLSHSAVGTPLFVHPRALVFVHDDLDVPHEFGLESAPKSLSVVSHDGRKLYEARAEFLHFTERIPGALRDDRHLMNLEVTFEGDRLYHPFGSEIAAADLATGQLLWRRRVADHAFTGRTTRIDGTLWAITMRGAVALSDDGEVLRHELLPRTPAHVTRGLLAIGLDGSLRRLDTGWTGTLGRKVTALPVENGDVVMVPTEGRLVFLDRAGQELAAHPVTVKPYDAWKRAGLFDRTQQAVPLDSGFAAIGTEENWLCLFDRTGHLVFDELFPGAVSELRSAGKYVALVATVPGEHRFELSLYSSTGERLGHMPLASGEKFELTTDGRIVICDKDAGLMRIARSR